MWDKVAGDLQTYPNYGVQGAIAIFLSKDTSFCLELQVPRIRVHLHLLVVFLSCAACPHASFACTFVCVAMRRRQLCSYICVLHVCTCCTCTRYAYAFAAYTLAACTLAACEFAACTRVACKHAARTRTRAIGRRLVVEDFHRFVEM